MLSIDVHSDCAGVRTGVRLRRGVRALAVSFLMATTAVLGGAVLAKEALAGEAQPSPAAQEAYGYWMEIPAQAVPAPALTGAVVVAEPKVELVVVVPASGGLAEGRLAQASEQELIYHQLTEAWRQDQ